jgi:GT2 family glycosyltransferase
VRRSAFDRIGVFDTEFTIACDGDWLARAKDAGLRSVMLEETLVHWRVHGANGSYDQDTMRRECVEMLRRTAHRQRAAAAHNG